MYGNFIHMGPVLFAIASTIFDVIMMGKWFALDGKIFRLFLKNFSHF